MATDAAGELVIDAFNRGLGFSALDDRLVKLGEYAAKLVGLELARNVRPSDHATFALPVEVDHGGKISPGAVLLLEERVVVAWSEGIVRPKPYSVACALAELSDLRAFKRKAGRVSSERDAISFLASGHKVEFVLYSLISQPRTPFMVNAALVGAITFRSGQMGDEQGATTSPPPSPEVTGAKATVAVEASPAPSPTAPAPPGPSGRYECANNACAAAGLPGPMPCCDVCGQATVFLPSTPGAADSAAASPVSTAATRECRNASCAAYGRPAARGVFCGSCGSRTVET